MSCARLHESLTRTVQGQHRLLFNILDWHKPHGWPSHSLADGLGICCVIFVALDIGFDELGSHESHGMAQFLKLAGPIVSATTSFHADQAGR
ncbi:hypothetical protein D3C81_2009520 [compost metagenome]